MTIIHKISDFLFDLFPKAKEMGNSLNILREELENFYTFGVYKPKVSIESDFIQVLIDVPTILNQKSDFDNVVALCERGNFREAKPLLQKLIKVNPTISEYHRILGQIFSEEGNQDEAINCLIDALRWDPRNGYALIMMGNIYARHKDDIATAQKYYNEAIALNPDDFIAINNLGTNLLQLGKWKEGLKYLEAAYDINPNYANTSYGLGLTHEKFGNSLVAFQYSISAMKKTPPTDQKLYSHALTLAIETAEKLIKENTGKRLISEFKKHLEQEGNKEIKVEINNEIETAAKIEFADNYNRNYHLVKYKDSYKAVEHLVMHELVHLDFALEAQKENSNMLFVSNGEMKSRFIRDNKKAFEKIAGGGYEESSISSYIDGLYSGLNRQIFNTPLDLFIEDFLFETYPELQPFQFVSLFNLVTEGKNAVTHKQAAKLVPTSILSTSKILNLVSALHFKDLFGLDLISKFQANPIEIRQAERFYDEFKEYRKDKKPGEEYELVAHWGEDLKLNKYFELVDENEFRKKRSNTDGIIESLEKDPLGLESDLTFKENEMQKFQDSAKKLGTNPAVMFFMVDALQYFKDLPKDKIKAIAFEIALLGTQGIAPGDEKKYKLTNIPNKSFSGYHMLAYYYVSWKLAIPEMLNDLHLPYDAEYEMAETMFKSKF
jgi:tetratricopeptide (TPR) repeat protein